MVAVRLTVVLNAGMLTVPLAKVKSVPLPVAVPVTVYVALEANPLGKDKFTGILTVVTLSSPEALADPNSITGGASLSLMV